MTIFDELEAQYIDIDEKYGRIEFEARSKQWVHKEKKYRRKRELNDQAYFLFMFSRLEDKIRSESSILIAKKQDSIISWRQRAVWDILPRKPEESNLKNRLVLLVPKGENNYNLVVKYYKERNSIAHGGSFTTEINMPTVISDFKRLYKVMKA